MRQRNIVASKKSSHGSRSRRKTLFIGKANFFAETLLVEAARRVLEKTHEVLFLDGHSPKIKSLLLNRKLSSHQPDKKYANCTGIRCLPVVWRAFFEGMAALFRAGLQSQGRRRKFYEGLLKAEYQGVPVGDCIFNSYLRFFHDTVRVDYAYLRTFFQVFKNLALWDKVLSEFSHPTLKKIFLIPEPVYHDESLRRFLLRRGFTEIRQDPATGRLTMLKNLPWGPRIMFDSFLSRQIKKSRLPKVEKELAALVSREKIYEGMNVNGGDINLNVKLQHGPNLSAAAVIFLHAISDAQYIYGISCFLDLHDWLMTTIQISRKQAIPLIVKCHPSFFNPNLIFPVDQMYLARLRKLFGIKPEKIPINEISATKVPGVYFVHHTCPPQSLTSKIPRVLFLTHHGSIATEAAFLGQNVICSKAGPYPAKVRFVRQYSTISEYEYLVQQWKNEKLQVPKAARRDLVWWAAKRRFNKDYKNHYYYFLLKKFAKKYQTSDPDKVFSQIEQGCVNQGVKKMVLNELVSKLS
jgi:hypothetical protein